MPDITVSYEGNTIATMSASGTKTFYTAGKYCDDDITLTYVSPGGGTDYLAPYLMGTLTSYESNDVTSLRANAIRSYSAFMSLKCHNITTVGALSLYATGITKLAFPNITSIAVQGLSSIGGSLTQIDFGGSLASLVNQAVSSNANLNVIVLRSTTITPMGATACINGTKFASGQSGGTIYIPKVLYDHLGDNSANDYKAATNWITVDGYGTITWEQIEGSYYETHYADDTLI